MKIQNKIEQQGSIKMMENIIGHKNYANMTIRCDISMLQNTTLL